MLSALCSLLSIECSLSFASLISLLHLSPLSLLHLSTLAIFLTQKLTVKPTPPYPAHLLSRLTLRHHELKQKPISPLFVTITHNKGRILKGRILKDDQTLQSYVEANLSARKIVLEVCDAIVKQGGRLAGAGIVGILQKMEEDSRGLIFGRRTVVAMDGGLYEHYPQYRGYLQDAVTELLGMEVSQNVIIEHSKDGSGIGAALLAVTNSKYDHNARQHHH